MFSKLNSEINKVVQHWYLPVIVGVLFIILSVLTFKEPEASYLSLSILFSVIFFVSGLSDVIFSLSNRQTLSNWGWTFVFGLISLILGVYLMANPLVSMVTLPMYIGFLVLMRSMMAIALSIDMSSIKGSGWGWVLVSGILGAILSFILISDPVLGGLTVVVWTGLTLLCIGVASVVLGFKLKGLK